MATHPIADIPDYDEPACDICGGTLERESCWYCLGAGGFHNDGEDTCACLDPDELTEACEECEGEGAYLVCPNAMRHARPEGGTPRPDHA